MTQIGRYSPETFEAEWLDGAGPGVGVRFRGSREAQRAGPDLLDHVHVKACEPGREFAFGVGSSDRPLNAWRYELSPTAAEPT